MNNHESAVKKAVIEVTVAPFFTDAKKKAPVFEKNPHVFIAGHSEKRAEPAPVSTGQK